MFTSGAFAQKNRIALLDLTVRDTESTDGNKFSAEQILKVAGIPYFVTNNVDSAMQSNFIFPSSNIESYTFTSSEKDSLQAFVLRGGTLFATQLKDAALFNMFGVSNYIYSTTHYGFDFLTDSTDNSFRWLDDVNEKHIKLADTSYSTAMNSRSYMLTTAVSLAKFDDDSVALTKNKYGNGYAYILGLNWKDLVLRNEVDKHYKAARTYSNGFEPGTDAFILFVRAVYAKHNNYAVWKHTSTLNSKSTLIITHDVDATTSIKDMMNNFADYEVSNKIVATYFITTHYMHDSLAKNFWYGYTDELNAVRLKGHEIGSHSVSHVPDFDIETTVPLGTNGNTEFTYQPFFNGHFSSNVTVCGEMEVSKLLLERDIHATIRSYRTGYLAYNDKTLNGLEMNGYTFNSSQSANEVLTAFPYQGHLDQSMTGAISSICEIPNTISDVFMADPISETNYNDKVAIWSDVVRRNAANSAATVLLIHPNRIWKIQAEQNLIRGLSSDVRIVPFEHFGDYWKAREATDFDYNMENDSSLVITVKNVSLPLHHDLSFIVDNGMLLSKIRVEDENHNPINMLQSKWETQSKILYSENFNPDYAGYFFVPDADNEVFSNYPNPFSTTTTFSFEVTGATSVILKIYDVSGRLVEEPIKQDIGMGFYEYKYENTHLSNGLYFYEFTIGNSKPVRKKMIVAGKPD
ncbi:MAG: T9SS type A sorting domain-containing protein [Bacteroidia bacterium]